MAVMNAMARMQASYEAEAAAKAKQKAMADALKGVPTVGKGATSFEAIDTWLSQNPDAAFFRIENSASKIGNGYMRRDSAGQSSDNAAAIVGTKGDRTSVVRRYATIQAAGAQAKGKRGEKATIGINYTPEDFYKANGFDYSADQGLILSRDEYGRLKEKAAKAGSSDQFLKTYQKNPMEQPDLKGKGNVQAMADTTRRADDLGADTGASALQSAEDTLTKRTLLG